jgi:hypothetical protein
MEKIKTNMLWSIEKELNQMAGSLSQIPGKTKPSIPTVEETDFSGRRPTTTCHIAKELMPQLNSAH